MPSKPSAAEPQWPPRSPHEALLSTPGGRQRYRQMARRQSLSPSPSRPRVWQPRGSLSAKSVKAYQARGPDSDSEEEGDDDDDDDEETLQLKLQMIQAKLKLKKLQASKTRKPAGAGEDTESELASRPESALLDKQQPRWSRAATSRVEPIPRPKSQSAVEVPASPVRRAQPTDQLSKSPSRILLGIDKGLTGKDVSLKRAPSHRRPQEQNNDRSAAGGYLQRSKTPNAGQTPAADEKARPLSFSERLASARTEEVDRRERQERIQKLRTTAFSVGREEIEDYKTKAIDIIDVESGPQAYSREEVLGSLAKPKTGGYLHRSNTAPSIRSSRGTDNSSQESPVTLEGSQQQKGAGKKGSKGPKGPDGAPADADTSSIEAYSGLHLSKRILPHSVVSRAVSGKKCYVLQDLLRHVKAPDFSLPDVEADVVVLAIVASKSDPRSHKPILDANGKPKQESADRGKYMVITLVDLTYSVELFLFKTGFDRFWKLSTGTVVAILNPTIMPPPRGREDTGRWGLVINSDADTILEIGTARDLGYCRSVKKDGQLCSEWINARRTEHCEFHTNEAITRARSSRNEINMAGFGGGGTRYKKNSREIFTRPPDRSRGAFYDRDTQSRWFVSGAGAAQSSSASSLIDLEGGMAGKAEREEGLKRRLASKERENDIARKLGEVGAGAGRDYMRRRVAEGAQTKQQEQQQQRGGGGGGGGLGSSILSSSSATMSTLSPSNPMAPPPKMDAKSLGLLPRKDAPIHLGPVKRKRPESSHSSSIAGGTRGSTAGTTTTTATTAAAAAGGGGGGPGLGWGSSLTKKLARMKDGENLKPASTNPLFPPQAPRAHPHPHPPSADTPRGGGEHSPVRKKTRFITDKGIREAGRESLGAELSAAGAKRFTVAPRQGGGNNHDEDDDDEDELIIVR